MGKYIIIGVILLLIIVGIVSLSPLGKDKGDGTTFHYYPKTNVYFDVERTRYIYLNSQKGEWEKAKELPGGKQDKLGKYVVINNPAQPVWSENSQHRLLYGVSLYASGDEVRRKFVEDSLRSIVRKTTPPPKKKTPAEIEEEEEKGSIERFFDRLFGGDKDKDKKKEEKKDNQ